MTDTRPCLVQDLLPETGVGLISGQWGTYKTFVAIDLAMAVIAGPNFIRFPVRRRGGVRSHRLRRPKRGGGPHQRGGRRPRN